MNSLFWQLLKFFSVFFLTGIFLSHLHHLTNKLSLEENYTPQLLDRRSLSALDVSSLKYQEWLCHSSSSGGATFCNTAMPLFIFDERTSSETAGCPLRLRRRLMFQFFLLISQRSMSTLDMTTSYAFGVPGVDTGAYCMEHRVSTLSTCCLSSFEGPRIVVTGQRASAKDLSYRF